MEMRRARRKEVEGERRQREGGSLLFGLQAKDNPLKYKASDS